MKLLKYLPLLALFYLASCYPPKEEIVTTFAGFIDGDKIDTLILYNSEQKFKIATDTNSFHDTINVEDGYYTLKIGSETTSMYWKEGYQIKLNINTKEFDESIVYDGKGAIENNLLANLYITRELITPSSRNLYNADEDDFIDSIKLISDSLKSIIKLSKADANLKQDQLDDVDYNYAREVQSYPSYHAYKTKNDSFQLSDNFKNYQIEYNKEDEDAYKRSSSYQILLNNYYFKIARDYKDERKTLIEGMQFSIDSIKNSFIKDNILKFYSRYLLEPTEDLESGYNFLEKNTSNEDFKANFKKVYDLQKTLLLGMPSPTFKDYENYAGGTSSLSDYHGSYVYIDVWATWCGPCLREIPSLKEMDSKYGEKNLKILSISIDNKEDHEKWKNFVNDKELSGIQLYAPNNWRSEFVEAYNIKGIPRFILLDKEGLIINADAPRPSSTEIHEVLNTLDI